jgi:hypothetical protein
VSKYADQLVEARKAKQLTREAAMDLLADLNMFGKQAGAEEGGLSRLGLAGSRLNSTLV